MKETLVIKKWNIKKELKAWYKFLKSIGFSEKELKMMGKGREVT